MPGIVTFSIATGTRGVTLSPSRGGGKGLAQSCCAGKKPGLQCELLKPSLCYGLTFMVGSVSQHTFFEHLLCARL